MEKLPDSGQRQSFTTGAQRDTEGGKSRPDLISPFFALRLGEHLRKGAEKYDERNWEKGIPISRCIASLTRHLNQFLACDYSEDHLAAMTCNLMFIMHYQAMIEKGNLPAELDDMPTYEDQIPEYIYAHAKEAMENEETDKIEHREVCNHCKRSFLILSEGHLYDKIRNHFYCMKPECSSQYFRIFK